MTTRDLVRVSATGMCKPCGNTQRVFVEGEWRVCGECGPKGEGSREMSGVWKCIRCGVHNAISEWKCRSCGGKQTS